MGPHFPEPTLPSCGHQPTTYLTGCQASDRSFKVFPTSVADLVLGSGPFHTPLWRLLGQIPRLERGRRWKESVAWALCLDLSRWMETSCEQNSHSRNPDTRRQHALPEGL